MKTPPVTAIVFAALCIIILLGTLAFSVLKVYVLIKLALSL